MYRDKKCKFLDYGFLNENSKEFYRVKDIP